MIENRQRIGFDSSLPGSGIIIYHIDESADGENYAWTSAGETPNLGHYMISIEQADSLWGLEKGISFGDDGDPFPGSTKNRNFNDYTNPSSLLYTGEKTNIEITNISDSKVIMSFDFSCVKG